MNLLPKCEQDFSKVEYWNSFFKNQEKRQFEWYGDYLELCGELHKYIKPKDNILVVGCGNSKLSFDLFDVGCRNITNIDISPVVIEQMSEARGEERSAMKFLQMDAMAMTFTEDEFSVVLDKGTLDALMPQQTDEDTLRAVAMFGEVAKVLKIGGRYMVISLLQEHILAAIFSYFTKVGWMLRIHRCHEVERKTLNETGRPGMPVFLVICTKIRKLEDLKPLLETSLFIEGKIERMNSEREVRALVKDLQMSCALCYQLGEGEEIELDLMVEEGKKARFTLRLVDGSKDQRLLRTYAAFIVQLGRETEWLFGSKEGRRHLQQKSGYDRLAVVSMHRGQSYPGLPAIQDELRHILLQFAPRSIALTPNNAQVPYLTLGDGMGRRETVFGGESALSGEMVVEQVQVDGETYRRLIFLKNQGVVQSEVKMRPVTSKKGQTKLVLDTTYVACSYLGHMSAATAMFASKPTATVLIVGVGGGVLCQITRQLFPNTHVTGVELDEVVVGVAKDWFYLKTDAHFSIVIQDGVKFMQEARAAGSTFDVVLLDVNTKEQGAAVSSPPSTFLVYDVLQTVSSIVGPTGVFVTNLMCRLDKDRKEVLRKLEKHFSLVCHYQLDQEVNHVVFCANHGGTTPGEWKKVIQEAAGVVNQRARQRMSRSSPLIDVDHLMEQLKLV